MNHRVLRSIGLGRLAQLAIGLLGMLSASISEAVEVAATKDVQIRSLYWNCPGLVPSSTTMRFGYELSTWSQLHRTLLHFDLDAAGVPAGASVASARLVFYADSQTGPNFEAGIYRLTTTDWTETATWAAANCDTPSDWTVQGGDYTATNSAAFTTKGSGFYNLDIADLAQDAVDSAGGQLHLLIKGPESALEHEWLDIRSSEHSDAATRPAVLITWAVAGGEAAQMAPAADTELSFIWQTCPSAAGGSTLGDDPKMQLGYDDNGKLTDRARPLLHFDLNAAGVPANAIVTSAALLFFAESQTGSDFNADVHRVTHPAWTETATWIDADCDSAVDWTTDGGDYDASSAASFGTNGIGYYSLDLTDLAQDAVTNRSQQLHFLMKATESGSDHWLYVRTREHANVDDRPVLSVAWITPTPTATPTITPTALPSPTPTDASTPTPTITPTATPTEGPPEVGPPPDLTAPPTPNDPNSIDPIRQGIARGQVRDANGALEGVAVQILDHPEYGTAYTRANGMFDMIVNGGGELTVTFEKDGYIPVHRKADVPWKDYLWVDDVVMIPYDTQVTTIDPNSPLDFQVHRASEIEGDEEGQDRQATLLFPHGTTTEQVLADGSTVPLSSFKVKATEFTFGPEGPEQMPAPLPPTSGYTYAVELSAHDPSTGEAFAGVQFSQPVIFYVENFIGSGVGRGVPVGYYDRQQGLWVPSENGEAIQIDSLDPNNAAVLITDDDPNTPPDNGVALGITYQERLKLGELYSVGQSLWRVSLTHFTPVDCNFPWWCEEREDCEPPPTPEPDPKPTPTECEQEGSSIGCQSQTLGEAVEIAGTPYRLHYRSDRARGYAASRSWTVRVTDAAPPSKLVRATITFFIAGRLFKQEFPPAPNQIATFTWDGHDAFGRIPLETQELHVRLTYWYNAVYYERAEFAKAFALLPDDVEFEFSEARQQILLSRGSRTLVPMGGRPLAFEFQSFGEWSLDVEKFFDSERQVLLGGDGRENRLPSTGPILGNVGGGGTGDPPNPATPTPVDGSQFGRIEDIAFLPDGSFYLADRGSMLIRYVDRDGILSTVAGLGTNMNEGAPALQAWVLSPGGLSVDAREQVYYTHRTILGHLVRRIQTEGCPSASPCVVTVAGVKGVIGGYNGDDQPATLAKLNSPADIDFGPDGGLYIADQFNHRVRKVQPDGTIVTVAGNGTQGYNGDGIPATTAKLNEPRGLAFGNDGSLYIAELSGHRIRRVAPDGIITTVAGTGVQGYDDGIIATLAKIAAPYHLVVTKDDSVYFSEDGNSMVRRITPEGVIERVAGRVSSGSPLHGDSGEGGLAFASGLRNPWAITRGPDGDLYISDGGVIDPPRIRRVGVYTPPVRQDGVGGTEKVVASEDGSELYVFNGAGQHVRTLDALTGQTRRRLTYEQGRLRFIEEIDGDGDGNLTEIERSSAGCATAIVAPGGQRTAFDVHPSSCQTLKITNPAGEAQEFTYEDGLMTSMKDARNHIWEFTYDSLGRLIRDDDPAGGYKTLSPEATEHGYEVTVATALGRETKYLVEQVPSDPNAPVLKEGGQREITTHPSGLQSVTETDRSATTRITSADGTKVEIKRGPDPRFGMLAPITTSRKITSPANLTSTVTTTRAVTLSDPLDPLSLTAQTDTVSVNGKQFQTVYTAADPNSPATVRSIGPSPLFRETLATLDDQGRVAKTEVPGLASIIWEYDAAGRLARIQHGDGNPNDPNDPTRQTLFEYYPDQTPDTAQDGLLWKTTDALGRVTEFEYDGAGRVTKQTLPDLREINYTYDANGNLESLTPPGRPAHGFNYTPVNLESWYIPPQPSPTIPEPRTQFVYNEDRQLAEILRPDGQTIDFSYGSSDGRLQSVSVSSDVRNYTYYGAAESSPGQLKTLTGPDADLSFTYDGSLLKNETWTIGTTSHTVGRTYNTNHQVQSLKIDTEPSIGFTYDNDGMLRFAGNLELIGDEDNGQLKGTVIDRIEDSYEYNQFGELSHYEARFLGDPNDPNAPSTILFAVDYQRDKLGRIAQKSETIEGETIVYAYSYDVAGRLWIVKQGPDESSFMVTATYTYDDNGNRLTKVTPSDTCNYSYDEQDRLLSSNCESSTTSYAYGANGELSSKNEAGEVTNYVYDAFGNLRAAVLHAGQPTEELVEYLVDGFHRRVGRKVNGTLVQQFVYKDQISPVAEFDGTGNLIAQFISGSKENLPNYVVKYGSNGGTYQLVSDALGSPRLVLNVSSGIVAQRIDLDEFGSVLDNTSPGFHPFGFAGGVHDELTQLVRFGARDYDPVTGRWLSRDPIGFAGGDANLYAYAATDPINLFDPRGLQSGTGSVVFDCLATTGSQMHMSRQSLNRCPSSEPKEGQPDCEGRTWSKDHAFGKYRGDDGSECKYEQGRLVPEGGTFNYHPFTYLPPNGVMGHFCADVVPQAAYGPPLPGTETYDCCESK